MDDRAIEVRLDTIEKNLDALRQELSEMRTQITENNNFYMEQFLEVKKCITQLVENLNRRFNNFDRQIEEKIGTIERRVDEHQTFIDRVNGMARLTVFALGSGCLITLLFFILDHFF